MHFNPLPRKEGDAPASVSVTVAVGISIHSLVKRETQMRCRFVTDFRDFNPLPRKEGDRDHCTVCRIYDYFNPLPRKEGDDILISDELIQKLISIHSLVKRETSRLC